MKEIINILTATEYDEIRCIDPYIKKKIQERIDGFYTNIMI